jgi:hypothetical protein
VYIRIEFTLCTLKYIKIKPKIKIRMKLLKNKILKLIDKVYIKQNFVILDVFLYVFVVHILR